MHKRALHGGERFYVYIPGATVSSSIFDPVFMLLRVEGGVMRTPGYMHTALGRARSMQDVKEASAFLCPMRPEAGWGSVQSALSSGHFFLA